MACLYHASENLRISRSHCLLVRENSTKLPAFKCERIKLFEKPGTSGVPSYRVDLLSPCMQKSPLLVQFGGLVAVKLCHQT